MAIHFAPFHNWSWFLFIQNCQFKHDIFYTDQFIANKVSQSWAVSEHYEVSLLQVWRKSTSGDFLHCVYSNLARGMDWRLSTTAMRSKWTSWRFPCTHQTKIHSSVNIQISSWYCPSQLKENVTDSLPSRFSTEYMFRHIFFELSRIHAVFSIHQEIRKHELDWFCPMEIDESNLKHSRQHQV